MEKLGTTATILYEDICRAGAQSENLAKITNKQVGTLLSLMGNGIIPEYREGVRRWRDKRKGKHGGYLRLSVVAKNFFSSENT